jgi:hypothetical protein
MDNKVSDTLGKVQQGLAKLLLSKIDDGTITAAEMAVARGLLKDNHIEAATPSANPALASLGIKLPTFDDAPLDNN